MEVQEDKMYAAARVICVVLLVAGLVALCAAGLLGCKANDKTEAPKDQPEALPVGAAAGFEQSGAEIVLLPVRFDGSEPEALPLVPLMDKPEEREPRYILSDAERDIVERVVMAESGAEDYDGQRLVAQCILRACEDMDVAPSVAVVKDKYTTPHSFASPSVKGAVSAVFDRGELVTAEPIRFFYAPALCYSAWHETQAFVLEHGGHRFFKQAE